MEHGDRKVPESVRLKAGAGGQYRKASAGRNEEKGRPVASVVRAAAPQLAPHAHIQWKHQPQGAQEWGLKSSL